jgi:hypothetical protein
MPAGSGRTTIALNAEANAAVDVLCERFPFKERSDAAKFGIAYAVRRGLSLLPGENVQAGGPSGTTWGVGGFDADGKLRELVLALYPENDDDPYVALEKLMNRGLVAVVAALAERRPQTLADLVRLAD